MCSGILFASRISADLDAVDPDRRLSNHPEGGGNEWYRVMRTLEVKSLNGYLGPHAIKISIQLSCPDIVSNLVLCIAAFHHHPRPE